MEFLKTVLDIFLHLDVHLGEVVRQYGAVTYAILFLIVFCETGLVVTPFLPGDSLLFAAGSLAALGSLDVFVMAPILAAACLCGDLVNYSAGRYLGEKIFRDPQARFLKRAYLDRTHHFYERYGSKALVAARFVPIVRTFAPFVAGMGRMRFRRYIFYCLAGAVLWVTVCVGAGYLFGNIPLVKRNFSVVILAIIFISLLPGLIGMLRARRSATAGPSGGV